MRWAVVTGCTRGIGEAISYKLLDVGYNLIGCYCSDEDSAKRFVENTARKYKSEVELKKVDLAELGNSKMFSEEIKAITSEIDVVVFCAGNTDRTPFGKIEQKTWENVMNVNLNTPVFFLQEIDELLVKKAKIIFISSILGNVPHATSLSYSVSKAAVQQLAKSLVKEYATRQITVNAIAPGFADTPWQKNKKREQRQRIENRIALKRFAEPEEIAKLCMSVIDNDYINGSVLKIDGGYDYF